MKNILCLLFLFSITVLPVRELGAAQERNSNIYTVKMTIMCENKEIEKEIQKHIKAQLRTIKDVKIIDQNPMYEIDVIAKEVSDYLATSIAFKDYLSPEAMFHALTNAIEAEALREALRTINSQEKKSAAYAGHSLALIPREQLENNFRGMVIHFNETILKSTRQGLQAAKELRKMQAK